MAQLYGVKPREAEPFTRPAGFRLHLFSFDFNVTG